MTNTTLQTCDGRPVKPRRLWQLGLAVALSVVASGAWAETRMIDQIEQLVAVLKDKPLTEAEVTANMQAITPNWQPYTLPPGEMAEGDWVVALSSLDKKEFFFCIHQGKTSLTKALNSGMKNYSFDPMLAQITVQRSNEKMAMTAFPELEKLDNGIPSDAIGLINCVLDRSGDDAAFWDTESDLARIQSLFTYAYQSKLIPRTHLAIFANARHASDRYMRRADITVREVKINTSNRLVATFATTVFILDPGQS